MLHVTLSAIGSHGWQPGIGDPTVYGWTAVAGYVTVALLCLLAWRKLRGRSGRSFWLLVTLAFAFLAINKQLDLQTWLTQTARQIARENGWYDRHRQLQQWFIGGVFCMAVALLVAMGLLVRWRSAAYWLTFSGLVCTTAFVVIRAASFHHVDHMLGRRLVFVPLNFALEFGGIVLTGCGPALLLWHDRQRSTHDSPMDHEAETHR